MRRFNLRRLWVARCAVLLWPLVAVGQGPPKETKPGDPLPPNMLYRLSPTYPAAAKAARIEGTVVLHAIIAADGSVESLEAISGPPALFTAAIEAVKHWVYKPYLVKGKAVRVDTKVYVNFKLATAS